MVIQKNWLCIQIPSILILLLLSGCSQNGFQRGPSLNTPTPIHPTATIAEQILISPEPVFIPTDTPPDQISCEWPPLQISETEVQSFFWSSDGKMLFYQEKKNPDQWMVFEIDPMTSRPIETNLVLIIKSNDIEHQIANEYSVSGQDSIYKSPTSNLIIFTIINEDGYDLYSKDDQNSPSRHLGQIEGPIVHEHVRWVDEGRTLIIPVYWMSQGTGDTYVYAVDIEKKTIESLIPNNLEFANFTVVEYTPDGKWILYVQYAGDDRHVWMVNRATGEKQRLEITDPTALKWLSDKEILVIGRINENRADSLYTYNLSKDEIKPLLPIFLEVYPTYRDKVQFSPSGNYIGYMSKEIGSLKLIHCPMYD